MDFIKLLIIFASIVTALRLKLSVGVTLFGAGLLAALLYQVVPMVVLEGYRSLVTSSRFISLTAIIVLITILGSLLKDIGTLERLSQASGRLYGGRRTATAILPPLVGLMPMPGGSLLSAPLVDSALGDSKFPPHMRCATNYWFRHIVEHFVPIYPGMIVTEGLTGIPVATVALLQLPLAVAMVIIGYFYFIRKIEPSGQIGGKIIGPLIEILKTTWPILFAVLLYGMAKIELPLAVLIALILAVVIYRPSLGILKRAVMKGLSYKLVFLIFGILSFQTVLDSSGAIASIQRLSLEYGFPEQLIIVVVCFAAGILTGMFAAFVALGYSLLAGFLYQPDINSANILLAFISGYVGMMLSPAHLCLVVTNNFFKSDMIKVYRAMAWPILWLCVAGALVYLSPWPEMIYPNLN